jgi:hypothetical protein
MTNHSEKLWKLDNIIICHFRHMIQIFIIYLLLSNIISYLLLHNHLPYGYTFIIINSYFLILFKQNLNYI